MATQTESNDISLDAKSCLSVAGPFPPPPSRPLYVQPFVFHVSYQPSPLPFSPRLFWSRADEIPRHETAGTFVRPKALEVFSISGQRPPRFRFCTPATYTHCQTIPTENHSLFRLCPPRPRTVRVDDPRRDTVNVQRSIDTDLLVYELCVCITRRVRKHRGESER